MIWLMVSTREERQREPKEGPSACFSERIVVPRVADSAPAGAKYLRGGQGRVGRCQVQAGRGITTEMQQGRGPAEHRTASPPPGGMLHKRLTTARWRQR